MFLKLNDFEKEFSEFVKVKDNDLYKNTGFLSIIKRTKTVINRLLFKKANIKLQNICSLKRDLYKIEQEYKNNLE